MGRKKRPRYEDCAQIIDTELLKRKSLWNLSSISWMDFDDVSQIIRLHVYKKWKQYDASKPVIPWLNKIISRQIKNVIRNVYGNYKRPCLGCDAFEGDNLCRIYEIQCAKCPVYAAWEKNKKNAYEIKLPMALESIENTAHNQYTSSISVADNIENHAKMIHAEMKKHLKQTEWQIYNLLFIQNKTEMEAAKILGLSSNEKDRSPRSRWINHVKRNIIQKVKALIRDNKIDI